MDLIYLEISDFYEAILLNVSDHCRFTLFKVFFFYHIWTYSKLKMSDHVQFYFT